MHKWKYRNPYDRTCELCDRHEQAFTHAWDLWRVYNEWKYTWWEEMYPPSTKACSGLIPNPLIPLKRTPPPCLKNKAVHLQWKSYALLFYRSSRVVKSLRFAVYKDSFPQPSYL